MTLDPICPRCSKPIPPQTRTIGDATPMHILCYGRNAVARALEAEGQARQASSRALGAVRRARDVVEIARVAGWACSACGHDLKNGRNLLFQGDQLVHAVCWRATPHSAASDPPPAAEAG
jgi:hypothetical protein